MALAKRFNVNRHTVRRAIQALTTSGLINVEQGRGTFVQVGAIDYTIGRRTRFTENVNRHQLAAAGKMLSAMRAKADPVTAKALRLRTGSYVYEIEFIHEADGVPLTYTRNSFPAARFDNLPAALEQAGRITDALVEYGITDYQRKWSRISCMVPEAAVARRLNINRQQAVLSVENVDVDLEGVPIKYGTAYFPADRVQLLVENENVPIDES